MSGRWITAWDGGIQVGKITGILIEKVLKWKVVIYYHTNESTVVVWMDQSDLALFSHRWIAYN